MQMTFRWYGKKDSIPLSHVHQIPGVTGLVWSLHDMAAGQDWPMERIESEMAFIKENGFNGDVVESVNVHEDIKLGLPSRKTYIDNYKSTIEKLGKVGVKVICYNFMPVFDWTRTDLYKKLPDGSTALFYEKSKVESISPFEFLENMKNQKGLAGMPGWEPERLARLKELFEAYNGFTKEKLWENLKYFLDEIIPVAEKSGIKMAIHPDDPPWDIFGLPRLVTSKESIAKFLKLNDSPSNGLTLCTGSLGSSDKNDLPDIIRTFVDRIYFAHIRNVLRYPNGDFTESSHRSCDGSLDIVEIVKAYHDAGFKYYCRPDHGRHIWDEEQRPGLHPGYGLYDRGMGIMYIWGIWDALQKVDKK
ncbi:MAG: mannonate dehydratase [Elusimicrobiota bacterium]|jgi:mannonate dehydratase|nr:mannonate dehydratase [Elusimicrobiota bacterium]